MELLAAFEPIRTLVKAENWPGVEESTSYGTPALKVRGKLILRMLDAHTLVLSCSVGEKQLLMDLAPEVYFETPHYSKYPWILAHLSKIDLDEVAEHIEHAWRQHARVNWIEEFDARKRDA